MKLSNSIYYIRSQGKKLNVVLTQIRGDYFNVMLRHHSMIELRSCSKTRQETSYSIQTRLIQNAVLLTFKLIATKSQAIAKNASDEILLKEKGKRQAEPQITNQNVIDYSILLIKVQKISILGLFRRCHNEAAIFPSWNCLI